MKNKRVRGDSSTVESFSGAFIGLLTLMFLLENTSFAGDTESISKWRKADLSRIEEDFESKLPVILFFTPNSSPLTPAAIRLHSSIGLVSWPAVMESQRWQINYTFGGSDDTLASLKRLFPDVVVPKEPTIIVLQHQQDIKYFFALDGLALEKYLKFLAESMPADNATRVTRQMERGQSAKSTESE